MALDSEEYTRQRAMLDNEWRIVESLDDLTPERKTLKEYDYAKLETRHAKGWDWDASDAVLSMIYGWLIKQNPSYIDLAVKYCYQRELTHTPALSRYIGEITSKRLNKEKLSGTMNKVLNTDVAERMLILMANLICYGDKVETAANKVARLYDENYPHLTERKAAWFEREYGERWRKPFKRSPFHPEELQKAADTLGIDVDLTNVPTPPNNLEEKHFQNWREQGFLPDEWHEQWRQLRNALPETTNDSLKGTRR